MSSFWDAVGNYWWLIFVFGGSIGGIARGVGAWNERRGQRRLEKYRIKQEASVARAEAESRGRIDAGAVHRELTAATQEYRDTEERWFAYETDLATLLDYPMLVDLREPLTEKFHRARSRVELLQPTEDSATDPGTVRTFRDAVHEYSASLRVAEAEARRRRRSDFSALEQERLARAQRLLQLAMNEGASPEERRQAYLRARTDLDGLISLPPEGSAALERQVRAALEAGPGTN
ncbi:hypothetical protein [Gordonia zhaorongruii]|uniref:hypothetical protein n=1 Tax=Gordonia zhaorongruii TaxID=2597659 RepID=UPI001047BBEF|nr:hypothetical protein [Gordonia zhaorongruii]